MSAVLSTFKLHVNQRSSTFITPLAIAGTVAVVSVVISLIFWRAGSEPGSPEWIQGSQSNPGIFFALTGFLIYFGVASVATTFPFALTLGATRRAFVAGTLAGYAFTAAYIAVMFAVLNALEQLTDHWFVGFYIFDVNVLGAGDTLRLLIIAFLGVITALTLGGVFGAAWVRFGARGPQFVALGIGLVVAVGLMIVIPDAPAIFAAFQAWWLAVAAGVVILLAAVGMWLLLRPATVR